LKEQAGENVKYELRASGEDNRPKDVDINQLKGWLRGPPDFEATISQGSTGLYYVVCRPTTPNVYYLDVQIGGRPIFSKTDMQTEIGSAVVLEHAKLFFELEGHGIHAGRVAEESKFHIKTKNERGSPMDVDMRGLGVACVGSHKVDVNVSRESMGSYVARFRVMVAGTYTIRVTYDDGMQVKEVLTQPVEFSDASSGRNSNLINLPPQQVRHNTPVHFAIQTKDQNGKTVSVGGDEWSAVSTGPERVSHIIITDNLNGTYSGEIIFPSTGNYSVAVMLNGEHANNSPFKVSVQ